MCTKNLLTLSSASEQPRTVDHHQNYRVHLAAKGHNRALGLFCSVIKVLRILNEILICASTDIVSVAIQSSSTKNCWTPMTSSNPCEPGDGTLFSLQSYCQGEGVMMTFRGDGSLVHSCSGKCVFKNAKDQLALRDGPCDTFTRPENPSETIVLTHTASGLCVNLDAANKLILTSCSSRYLFELTQSGN